MHYKDKLLYVKIALFLSLSFIEWNRKKIAMEQKELSEAIQPLACFPIFSLSLGQTLLRLLHYPLFLLSTGGGV